MTTELTILAWTLVLAIVQILGASFMRARETGAEYSAGPRDGEGPPMGVVTARLKRAQSNLFETLPLFAAAVLIAGQADIHSGMTVWGAALYLIGRVLYVPLYAMGVPYLRSVVWGVAIAGLGLLLLEILLRS